MTIKPLTEMPGYSQALDHLVSLEIRKKDGVPEQPAQNAPISLQLHHIPSKEGLIVKIQPPKAPSKPTHHVPCDIVLVIDISGSMGTSAPVPGEGASEDTGLSVLDLTKHAAFTIIETMDEKDRLGIVTFGTKSKIIQGLEPMTDGNKYTARKRIKSLEPIDSTNLWHGILDGIKVFDKAKDNSRVPAIMVLTDGMPNHMCPAKGYIPKLKTMPPLPASIHTFGFGYSLRSGLLKSISEYSGGNYAFIPDAGMIGTVFVHAVANLQATYATNATLTIRYKQGVEVYDEMGDAVDKESAVYVGNEVMSLTVPLGNIQYGQSRDIWFRLKKPAELGQANIETEKEEIFLTATAKFKETETSTRQYLKAILSSSNIGSCSLSGAEVAYHESRARICKYLSSLFPLGSDGEHRATTLIGANGYHAKQLPSESNELPQLIQNLPAQNFTDEQNKSLLEDLNGALPKGQISLAVSTSEAFHKWGQHFLPSYLNAHTRQICNSFKDSGPLQYGVDSPLFIECRDRLDDAFDNIPPPEPSRTIYQINASAGHGHTNRVISMRSYRNASGVCFAGSTPVELASGRKIQIRRLRRGLRVQTPLGPRKVAMVLRTPVVNETLLRVGGVFVTPWHPMSTNGKTWDFPIHMADKVARYTGSVYSVLLQQDGNSRAHAIRVGEMWGVTLGHGITTGSDIRAHEFFGDYLSVGKSLARLPSGGKPGVVMGRGVERDSETGLVKGFKHAGRKPSAAPAPAPAPEALKPETVMMQYNGLAIPRVVY